VVPLSTLNATPLDWLRAARRPPWTDVVIAIALTAAALADLGAYGRHGPGWVAVTACIALTGSIVGPRRYPSIGVVVAALGLAALALSGPHQGSGLPELAVVFWLFYSFGQGHHPRGRTMVGLSAWVAASVVVGLCYPNGPLANGSGGLVANAAFWALSGIIPFSLGAAISVYGERSGRLETAAAQLRKRQAEHAERAAGAERAKMARELHDVVAHSVSVIVVQTTGARRVMSTDTDMALKALAAVETAGREALVELRRIVGILRRGDFVSEDLATPGLAHLRRLIDQARDAGLAVDLAIEGVAPPMSPGLELAIYRVVQEGLTNTIKHVGPATARVTLLFAARSVTVEVCDDGAGSGIAYIRPSGHGLIGLRERVHLYGGTLRAGPRTAGGFEIRANIPLNGEEPTHRPTRATAPQSRAKRWPALDPLFAAGFLLLLEITTLTAHVQGGTMYRDVVAVAAMTAAFAWRRRQPLCFVIIVVAMALSLSSQVAPQTSAFTAIYVSVIPAYTVAAWESRIRAGVGLAILAVAPAIHQVMVHQLNVSSSAGFLFVIALVWLAGRAVRSRRGRAAGLEHTTFLLVTERENQAELAIAGERSRIARELHAVVAQNVAVMVVQAEAAAGQLVEDPAGADESLQAIETTGRQVLSEMRRILGVLRYNNGGPRELSPQPGVDQIHRLLHRWRQDGLQIDLTVRGEPGALSPGIDLAVYRIVEEILNVAEQRSAVAIELKFGDDDIELATDVYPKDRAWPPASISERVSLCGGELRTDSDRDQRSLRRHLSARLPSGLAAALP
jgi:signal transduction histidine kinase